MTELFNLQLFAEDAPAQGAESQETDPKSGEGKPAEKPAAVAHTNHLSAYSVKPQRVTAAHP